MCLCELSHDGRLHLWCQGFFSDRFDLLERGATSDSDTLYEWLCFRTAVLSAKEVFGPNRASESLGSLVSGTEVLGPLCQELRRLLLHPTRETTFLFLMLI